MTKYFTHYWLNKTCDNQQKTTQLGERLDYTAGNLFRSKGVTVKNIIYIVTNGKGKLYILVKMEAAGIYNQGRVAKILGIYPAKLWEAEDHIVASKCSKIKFHNSVNINDVSRCYLLATKVIFP